MSSDINKGGRVEPTNSTNLEKETKIDSDTTPLLGGSHYTISRNSYVSMDNIIQKIKNRLGSIKGFFVRHFKFEGYTLVEGSHKPLGNKLASMLRSIKNFSVNLFRFKNEPPINNMNHDWILPMSFLDIKQLDNHKHSGNKLASMLGSIKGFFVRHFKFEGYTLIEGSHKPLGNKMASMLRSIKNFSASHFKVKKVVPTKQGNIQDYIINIDGRKYIMCAGNRLVDISDGLDNARDCIINIKGRKYIACADNTLVDVSDWLEELNVAQTKVTQTEVTKTAQPPILRY